MESELNDKATDPISIGSSEFTGGAFSNYFRALAVGLVSAISLGIAYPAMRCRYLRWEAAHTFVDGKRLVFCGSAAQLFGNYIKWLLLSIITFGLYFILAGQVKITEWETRNTHFAGLETSDENASEFSGKWYALFAVNFVTSLINSVTLFLAYSWTHCYAERWFWEHKTIDGYKLRFNGTGGQFFVKQIVWALLTVITFGIYSFWMTVKIKKWTVSHTHAKNVEALYSELENVQVEPVDESVTKEPKNTVGLVGFILAIASYSMIMEHAASYHLDSFISVALFEIIIFILNIVGVVRLKRTEQYRGFAITGLVLSSIIIIQLCVHGFV